MKTYDWIVVGGGITGAALSYELAKKGFCVLLLEQYATPQNATRYSYGGLAYWSGKTALTRQLFTEGIARHRILSEELGSNTQFRELDLLLTISTEADPEAVAASYSHFAIPPRSLSVAEACELEPLLNPEAIAGALTVKHGHIHPEMTAQGYIQAFLRAGGKMQIAQVLGLLLEDDTPRGLCQRQRFQAVKTITEIYHSANVVICAGGFSRALLKSAGISIQLYFTYEELIKTPPVEVQLQTLVMPAQMKRFELEAESSKVERLWNEPGNEPVPPILDPGAIQFLDGSLLLGQLSRVLTDPNAKVNPAESEAAIRRSVGQVLPALGKLPGTCHHCLVAFSSVREACPKDSRLPVVGAVPGVEGVHLFSGFSHPLLIVPPLAQRFAHWAAGQNDHIISQLSPQRG